MFSLRQLLTSLLTQETWEFITVGSSHMHTHACVSLGASCISGGAFREGLGGLRGDEVQKTDFNEWISSANKRGFFAAKKSLKITND